MCVCTHGSRSPSRHRARHRADGGRAEAPAWEAALGRWPLLAGADRQRLGAWASLAYTDRGGEDNYFKSLIPFQFLF